MVWSTVTAKDYGRRGRSLLLACLLGLALLGLALLVGHQLVMASARHVDIMVMDPGAVRPSTVTTWAVAAPADDRNPHAIPGNRQPPAGWRACLSPDGVLPGLLLLLACAGLWGRRASVTLPDTRRHVGARAARFPPPPPLEPRRRRALLQVFLI